MIKILYVDQAVDFGGSIVSIACLINNLDRTKFEPIIVGEVPNDILRNHVADDVRYIKNIHYINYSHWMRLNRILENTSHSLLKN